MNEASQSLLEYLRSDWSHDLKEVRELLKNGADVNAVDQMGNSPLLLEWISGLFHSDDVSEFLLKKGADIHHRNHAGQSALMLTTSEGFANTLIQAGVDVNATDDNGNSAVHYAYWNKKTLGLLVKAGASLHHLNKMQQSLLHVSVGNGSCIDTVTLKWLLKQGVDPNAKDINGLTPLHAICRLYCEHPHKLATVLIESGADPAVLDGSGTPLSLYHLQEGLQDGNDYFTEWLAEKGASPFDAIILGDQAKVEQHFPHGVSVSPARRGFTPLHVAALTKSKPEIVDRLIKSSTNHDQLDEDGRSALMLAISNQLPEMAIALIKAGASPIITIPDENKCLMEEVASMAHPVLLAALIQGKTESELDKLVGPYTKLFNFNQNSLDCLNLLVQSGISPVAVDIEGSLARNRHINKPEPSATVAMLDLFNALIERGAKPSLCPEAQICLVNFLINHKKSGLADTAKRILIHCLSKGMSSKWTEASSLLHKAVEAKDVSLIESILANNEELVFPSSGHIRSPLRDAVQDRFEAGVSLLLSAGEKVINDGILDEAIEYCRSEEIMAMLLDYKARSSGSFNVLDPVSLLEAAEDASKRGMTDILESLIEKGLSLNSMNDGTPIFHTLLSHKGDVQTVDWAEKHGADLTISDINGQNLLHKSFSHNYLNSDLYQYLISYGLNINARDGKGKTPFHLFIDILDLDLGSDNPPYWKGYLDIAKSIATLRKLLDMGADPKVTDNAGTTPLMSAAIISNPECIQFLIDVGVSPLERDTKGNTALSCFKRGRNRVENVKKCIRLLVSAGLHPDDSGDKKHLNDALAEDDIPFAIWLLEQQAKVSQCDLSNKTVLAALSKIIRSRPELVSSQIDSLGSEQRSLLETLLSKSINAPAEADYDELPELLREGGWPIPVPSRVQVVASKVALPEREARLIWKDDEQKRILATRRVRPVPEADIKFEEAIARFEKKPYQLKIETLLRPRDELFVNYWNAHSAALSPYVVVFDRGSSWFNVLGFRAEDFRYLLARYGLAVLPGILNLAAKKPMPVVKALTNVDAPACALQVAKFMTGSTSRLARRWLSAYPESAIHGLITPAVGKPGKDRDAAEAALRFLASKGHRESIESLASSAGAEVAVSINEILSVDPRSDYMPKKFPAMPSFWDSGIHPRPLLRNGGKALPLSAVEMLARMMSISTYDARTPALDEAIDAFEPDSLADFAWSVFDEWRAKGDSASNWMFQALSYMGNERCAKKLTPIIRDWPASNGQAKALMGLDILASIGTDVALAQIQSIARKNKYKPIVARADEMLTAIAEARELTTEQFEDRLVPTLGLDENGTLLLDYGKRQFFAGVDESLKPRLSDETGAAIKELPKPGKDDDKAMAKLASEQWAEFKAELKPVTSIQLLRLENAMIDSRRWSGDEFQRLVAGHPLLLKSVRSLVWGVFNEKGKLVRTFRILQDGSYQDVKGKPIEVQAAALVGIPHPLSLGDETSAWKQVFADSRQGQAFAQLVRKTYRRSEDEEMDYFGLQGAVVHAKSLKGLKSMGWEMSLSGFADLIDHYYRSFPGGDVELHVEPGVFIRDLGNTAEEQTIELTVPKKLHDIEFSELMRELHTLKK